MMVVKNESYLEAREISPGISSHLQVFELAWLYSVHQDKKESKEGWRDISRPDIKWIDVMVHLQDKKEMNQNYFRKQQKIRK
jgi:hypothetical protein